MNPASQSFATRATRACEPALVLLLPALLFAAAIWPATRFNDVDCFYHYKVAQLIGSGKPWVDIPWLPYTVLGQHGPDHHWLFHVLIAPFTWQKDDMAGLKVAIIVTASLVVPALYWLLRRWHVPHAWLFALLAVFGAQEATWRFEMLRAQNLSVVLACLFVYFLVRRRHFAVFILVWAFFNAYHGAVVTLPIFLCFFAWHWLNGRRLDLQPLIVYLAAVASALVLNPWFPKDVEYLMFHTLYKVPNHLGDNVGGEWLAYPLKHFLADNALLHGLELILLVQTARDLAEKKARLRQIPAETAVFVAMSGLMFIETLSSMRFIEYYAPFSAVSSGLLLRDIASRRQSPAADRPAVPRRLGRRHAAVALVSLLLLACMGRSLLRTPAQQVFDVAAYEPLAAYLEQNVPKGTLLFNSAWPDFPLLLWHTTDYPMANGLDAHYLAFGDAQRFELWFKVTQQHQFAYADMAHSIARSFNTRWMLVHSADRDLAQYLMASHQASLRFSYRYGWLFEIEAP